MHMCSCFQNKVCVLGTVLTASHFLNIRKVFVFFIFTVESPCLDDCIFCEWRPFWSDAHRVMMRLTAAELWSCHELSRSLCIEP